MFLRLFRSNTNLQLIMIFIIVVLLWSDGFYMMQPALSGNELSPLYTMLFGWAAAYPLPGIALALLLILLEAFLLNNMLAFSGITIRNSYLPAFFYILLFSYCPGLLRMYPVIPANLMLILGIRMLWKSLQREQAYQEIFTAALFISLAVFFNIYFLILVPIVWISLIINRTISWRDWFIALLGTLTPVMYIVFLFFWNDQFKEMGWAYLHFFKSVRLLPSSYSFDLMIWISAGMVVFLTLFSFLRFVISISEKLISIRKVSQLMVWLFFLSAVAFFIIPADPLLLGSFVLLPVSVFMASWMLSGKSSWMKEFLLWVLIGCIVAGKFVL